MHKGESKDEQKETKQKDTKGEEESSSVRVTNKSPWHMKTPPIAPLHLHAAWNTQHEQVLGRAHTSQAATCRYPFTVSFLIKLDREDGWL